MRFSFHCWNCGGTNYYEAQVLAEEGMKNHAETTGHVAFTIQKNGKDIIAIEYLK